MKPAFKFYAAVAVRSLLVALAVMPLQAHATEETTDPYQDNLLGDIGGYRGMLSAHGVDVGVEYKGDTWGVVSGGQNKGTSYNDNLDIKFALDGEKLAGISGNKAMVYFINNFGGHPNATRVGSVQGIDNIETGTDTFKLYELWDEQSFLNDRVSVLFGLHDLNSEFDLTDMTANFIKPTMQIGQAFAQSGVNGPSIFPTTSLAGRVKVAPTKESYVSVAAFDGVPGDPNDARGTHVQLHSRDGLLLVGKPA